MSPVPRSITCGNDGRDPPRRRRARIGLPPTYNAFAYVISGSLDAATETQVIWFEREEGNVTLTTRTDTHAILFAGEPVHESVVQRSPFAMSTISEILHAYADYAEGRL